MSRNYRVTFYNPLGVEVKVRHLRYKVRYLKYTSNPIAPTSFRYLSETQICAFRKKDKAKHVSRLKREIMMQPGFNNIFSSREQLFRVFARRNVPLEYYYYYLFFFLEHHYALRNVPRVLSNLKHLYRNTVIAGNNSICKCANDNGRGNNQKAIFGY